MADTNTLEKEEKGLESEGESQKKPTKKMSSDELVSYFKRAVDGKVYADDELFTFTYGVGLDLISAHLKSIGESKSRKHICDIANKGSVGPEVFSLAILNNQYARYNDLKKGIEPRQQQPGHEHVKGLAKAFLHGDARLYVPGLQEVYEYAGLADILEDAKTEKGLQTSEMKIFSTLGSQVGALIEEIQILMMKNQNQQNQINEKDKKIELLSKENQELRRIIDKKEKKADKSKAVLHEKITELTNLAETIAKKAEGLPQAQQQAYNQQLELINNLIDSLKGS